MGIDIEVSVKFTSDNPADSSVVADVMTAIGKAQGNVSGGSGNGGTPPTTEPPPAPAAMNAPARPGQGQQTRR